MSAQKHPAATSSTSPAGPEALAALKYAPEADLVPRLLADYPLGGAERTKVSEAAAALVEACRARAKERSLLDAFLSEFGLSDEEGVGLMCLAEALLRVPDAETADALIADKIRSGQWAEHLGHSQSAFVNAATFGLMLTGRLVRLEDAKWRDPGSFVEGIVRRAGEPVVRRALLSAMRILGDEFVLGRTIEEALKRARGRDAGGLCSFDMLGEGARTTPDAERYCASYAQAIGAVGAAAAGKGPREGHGISVKLSALHPRYEVAQSTRVHKELYRRLLGLAEMAAAHGIGFTVDAEEADRLELSLELFERLAREPGLKSWTGLGLAVQAYGRRAGGVIDWIAELGQSLERRFMIRLVKGAYWDTEIKHAQEMGAPEFPVFTRKPATDVSYLVCAARMLREPKAIFPQFATHNAHTLTAILQLAEGKRDFEFQRLHGMGELLYDAARKEFGPFPPVRVYAPVGGHQDLLAYLVRRLLENGANSSFVNRFLDDAVPAAQVVADPAAALVSARPPANPAIRAPAALFAPERENSRGLDLSDRASVLSIAEATAAERGTVRAWLYPPEEVAETLEIRNPADTEDLVGLVPCPPPTAVEEALGAARAAQPAWDRQGGKARAHTLRAVADRMEAQTVSLMALITREAGRTLPDALSEVREAVDFCRYYAARAEAEFETAQTLPGPVGEENTLRLHGRGVFAAISPWNFPLAIFTGQVAAALAAGNAVLAKPAEQAPFVAAEAVRLFHDAGLARDLLHLLPGRGETVGAALVKQPDLAGVVFTGSTHTARAINRALAARDGPIVPLIAETGGQNAMVVDSTALPEQVTDDVIRSAFGSAGQRCSSLRILLLQEEIADKILHMLTGAMAELTIGDPDNIGTDIGPIIDAPALEALKAHLDTFRAKGRVLASSALPPGSARGHFLAPQILALEAVDELAGEVFGPLLHVIRYRTEDLGGHLEALRATGYGLTLGIHSRIGASADHVISSVPAGNTYVNRSMTGAVVGSQPFGGEGLSGTGPKAGGPHYLHRFATERVRTVNLTATGGNAALLAMGEEPGKT